MRPVLLPVTHRLTGREDQVVNVLTAAHARGHLVDYHSPERLDDERVSITIILLQPATTPGPEFAPRDTGGVRRLLLAVTALVGLAGAAALAAVGWGVWLHLEWIHAHPWVFVGEVVVAVILTGTAVASARSNGWGCGHR